MTPGQIAFEAYKDAFDKEKGAWFTSMSYKWETLPDFLRVGWEAAAKAVMESGAHIDGKIRQVVEQALKDLQTNPTILPELYRNDAWPPYVESVEWAIGDDGDITRRVYIRHTLENSALVFWLRDRLAEVHNGDNIEIVMEW